MKLTLSHRNHAPSASIVGTLEKELQSLQPDLQIDEARVRFERSLTESPPFSVAFHLVTPGPDIIVKSTDHTLRAAMMKAIERIREKIGQRRAKRVRRRADTHVTAFPRRLSPPPLHS
jgi:ribosome-associated translation inhibitor RaiA